MRRRSTSLGNTRPNILIAPLVTVRFDDQRHRAFTNATAANDARPSFICSNASLSRDKRAAGVDVDHAASS
jgi:hypothetical protein